MRKNCTIRLVRKIYILGIAEEIYRSDKFWSRGVNFCIWPNYYYNWENVLQICIKQFSLIICKKDIWLWIFAIQYFGGDNQFYSLKNLIMGIYIFLIVEHLILLFMFANLICFSIFCYKNTNLKTVLTRKYHLKKFRFTLKMLGINIS